MVTAASMAFKEMMIWEENDRQTGLPGLNPGRTGLEQHKT